MFEKLHNLSSLTIFRAETHVHIFLTQECNKFDSANFEKKVYNLFKRWNLIRMKLLQFSSLLHAIFTIAFLKKKFKNKKELKSVTICDFKVTRYVHETVIFDETFPV